MIQRIENAGSDVPHQLSKRRGLRDPGSYQDGAREVADGPFHIQRVATDVFRPDNRVVLTYLPELPPADSSAVDSEAAEAEEAAA